MTAQPPDTTDDRLAAYVRVSDVPMMVLALATIPLLVIEDVATGAGAQAAVVANWVIWALFTVDLAIRVRLVPTGRLRYLKRHWYDVAIIVVTAIPYLLPIRALRSVRVLRALRVLRVAVYAVRAWHSATRAWDSMIGRRLAMMLVVLVVAGSVGIWLVERDTNAKLERYSDAAWWAITTVTTVGYGDIVPVTIEGRLIAGVLMLLGITTFGLVTANVAAVLTRRATADKQPGDYDGPGPL